eukprot:1148766-Pelagomonas_calceolata.AAC.13
MENLSCKWARVYVNITSHLVRPANKQLKHTWSIMGYLHDIFWNRADNAGSASTREAELWCPLSGQLAVMHSTVPASTCSYELQASLPPPQTANIYLGGGDEQVLQVVSIATQPVLQRLHKVACILGLIAGQELEHLGQGAHQLQQALLKVVIVLHA